MRKLLLLACCAVAACSGADGLKGAMGPLAGQDASTIAYDVTQLVQQQAHPATGTIAIQRPAGDTTLFPLLVSDLGTGGFEVVEGDHAKHYLQYAVSVLPEGTILRVRIDGISGARLYTPGAGGHLAANGPFTMQEAAE